MKRVLNKRVRGCKRVKRVRRYEREREKERERVVKTAREKDVPNK